MSISQQFPAVLQPQAFYRHSTVVTAALAASRRICPGDNKRVSVSVATDPAMDLFFSIAATLDATNRFASFVLATNAVITYREFGPLVQGEIWILGGAAQLCSIFEIIDPNFDPFLSPAWK